MLIIIIIAGEEEEKHSMVARTSQGPDMTLCTADLNEWLSDLCYDPNGSGMPLVEKQNVHKLPNPCICMHTHAIIYHGNNSIYVNESSSEGCHHPRSQARKVYWGLNNHYMVLGPLIL